LEHLCALARRVARVCELAGAPLKGATKALSNSHRSIVAIAAAATLAVPSLATAQHPAALGDLITSTVKEPLAALDRAIQAKDANQFTAAYGQLTASCNARHKSYDRTAIVIQPPTAAATFPDQDFRPPTK